MIRTRSFQTVEFATILGDLQDDNTTYQHMTEDTVPEIGVSVKPGADVTAAQLIDSNSLIGGGSFPLSRGPDQNGNQNWSGGMPTLVVGQYTIQIDGTDADSNSAIRTSILTIGSMAAFTLGFSLGFKS